MKLTKLPFITVFFISIFVCIALNIVVYSLTKNSSFQSYILLILNVLFALSFVFLNSQMIFSELTKHKKNSDDIFHQMESFYFINRFISPKFPIGNTRNWIASPDFIQIIFKNILLHKPKNIVELGSGVSTIYTAYLIQNSNLDCTITSIDHSEKYTIQTNNELLSHELQNIAHVHYSPLTEQKLHNEIYNWYTFSSAVIPKIDLLVIDGPITIKGNERFPAIPVLYDSLAPNARIIIDDYFRKGETKMVQDWLKLYPDLELKETLYTEKGAAVLRKKN